MQRLLARIGVLFIALLAFTGCSKDYNAIDLEVIQAYIAANNLDAVEGPEGLYYVIDQEGTGAHPTETSNVTVHYEGSLTNGRVFDSSFDRGLPATFSLQQVIRGWTIGIPLFKEKGGGKLILPSRLAYGSNPPPGIPSNSVLIFDVNLIEVN